MFRKNRLSRVVLILRLVMASDLWVHELGMFIYLILALLQANKLSDDRLKKHNKIQQYVYITCKCTSMPENSTHKCTNAVNNVQPIKNSSHMAKVLSVYNRLQAGDYEDGNGAREG